MGYLIYCGFQEPVLHNLNLSVNILFLKRCDIFQFCLQSKNCQVIKPGRIAAIE